MREKSPIRCTTCRHVYALGNATRGCPACGGPSWVAAAFRADEDEQSATGLGTEHERR